MLCVRWYLRYCLTLRDLEELMTERGLSVDHSTIGRWVLRYAPELNKRVRREIRPRVINVDGHASYPAAIAQLKESGELGRCQCRPCPYLNHVHQAIPHHQAGMVRLPGADRHTGNRTEEAA